MQWIFPQITRDANESLISYLLRLRGVVNGTQFLQPELSQLHDWRLLHDVATAGKFILQAIENKQKIFIHGDFDVDGVCATSILWDFLYRKLGADVLPYIPSRFDQGYGLTESSIQDMLSQGAQLIITVDCGVKDLELVKKYQAQGINFIITDHHTLPTDEAGNPMVSSDAVAVVHPRHPQGNYPFVEICGTGVAWKLVVGLNDLSGKEFDVFSYLDLVALATVCDVMPLVDENRIIVKYGLERLRKTQNLGLLALLKLASVEPKQTDAYHFGFVIGPRLNAAGRLETALDAVRLLTTQSQSAAGEYAARLNALNVERQNLTQQLLADAEAKLQTQLENPIMIAYGNEWPEGIVGLVAGKLTEKYYRPTIIGSINAGSMKASARSIDGFHISEALAEVGHLLEKFGGHEMAAGFTLPTKNLIEFQHTLTKLAAEKLDVEQLERKLKIDAVVPADQCNFDLVTELEVLAPFGFGNAQPVIAIENLTIQNIRKFGSDNQHIQFRAQEMPQVEIIGFNCAADYADITPGDKIQVAGQLGVKEWQGRRSLQVRIKDIKKA